jgi:hypothetical protein
MSLDAQPCDGTGVDSLDGGGTMAGMEDIIARIDALLANTPQSEIEEFEVTRCLRDCRDEIKRLRTQGDGLADRVGSLFRETQELYRHIATQQPWIPVSERLPEQGEHVLGFCSKIGTQVAHLTDESAWYWGTSGVLGYDATHWMPLPEPPEVK